MKNQTNRLSMAIKNRMSWRSGIFAALMASVSLFAGCGQSAVLDHLTEVEWIEEEAVQEAKKNREWRHEYMTLLMRDQENVEKGKEYGEELMAKLIMLLNEDGRLSDIVRVSQDKEYRQSLYLEYHII